MAVAVRLCGAVLREGALWVSALALHWGAAALMAWLLLAPRPAMPTPRLKAESLELTLAETESEIAREAAASPPVPTAAMPVPESAPYLSDAASPVALPPAPEAIAPPISALRPDPLPAPPLPDRAPREAHLPEISLPPAQTPPTARPQTAAGATVRLEHPRLTTDLSRLLKHYPPLARRNGWEGTVVLALEVAADGTLAKAPEVHRSSGHPVLDEAALRMIRRARFEGGPGTLLQPIEYRLR